VGVRGGWMSKGVRVIGPHRAELRWDMVDWTANCRTTSGRGWFGRLSKAWI
jgi:hypothetical protein